MDRNLTQQKAKGIGFSGILGLIFITLKLCNVINWSWWWVLLPIYLPIPIFIIMFIVGVFIGLVIELKRIRK